MAWTDCYLCSVCICQELVLTKVSTSLCTDDLLLRYTWILLGMMAVVAVIRLLYFIAYIISFGFIQSF